MMYTLKLLIEEEYTSRTIEQIDSLSPVDIFISEKMIQHLMEIMEQSRLKLILFFQQFKTDRAPPDFNIYTLKETIAYLLHYPPLKNEHPARGAYHLSVLYYKMLGSYHKNARFLFGTASQFCR